MSQNDFVIANQTAPAFRTDLNTALQALASLNSGTSAPTTTYANMLWYDTTNNILKMRSEADDAWIDLGTLDQGANTFEPAGLTELSQVQVEDDTDTTFGYVTGQRLSQMFDDREAQLGVGQTWQDVIGSRATSTSYQNTTGKPIYVGMTGKGVNTRDVQVSVDNSTWITVSNLSDSTELDSANFIVPNNWYYRINGSCTSLKWAELR